MSIDGPTKGELAREMSAAIAKHVQNPSEWPIEARRVAESLELDVTRIRLYAGTLFEVCFDIADNASKQRGYSALVVRGAIVEIALRRAGPS
jgi:hypothetical protein